MGLWSISTDAPGGFDMTLATTGVQQVLDRESDQIAQRIGADPDQTRQAIALALPTLLAGLQGQAAPGSGLQQAVLQDHDGSILDDIAGYLNGSANLGERTTNGVGILEHVLGPQQPEVQRALSSQSGLSLSSITQLLPLLAPIVMGMLGRQARSDSGSHQSGGIGDLGSILGGLTGAFGGATAGPASDPTASGAGSNQQISDLLKSLSGGR
jgi:hypothetical protein